MFGGFTRTIPAKIMKRYCSSIYVAVSSDASQSAHDQARITPCL